ncbi:MAG: DUF4178 domain-containing protein [Chloroflexi bacterium]|nr:MAG: DUF4178 domain-containing protein [Chloroflexota bacterium]
MEDLELRLEQQRRRIAASIPGYLGYRERERRRDADRALRAELARQYSAQLDRLTELQRRATDKALLSALDDMERAGLKLQRFIDRLRTASYGYAGWFDTATVREVELEQLYAFDHLLAAGIERVAADVDAIAGAVDAGAEVEQAVEALASTVDDLNRRFDQRRDLLAEGKKAPPNELKEALEVEVPPSPAFLALADLKVDDALSYDGIDYLVIAKVTYDAQGRAVYAYQLEDTGTDRWLRVGTTDGDVALFDVVDESVSIPPAEMLEEAGESFRQTGQGQAKAYIVGPGGRREGMAEYWLYASEAGSRLWVERWGDQVRVHRGQPVDPEQIKVWTRK